MEQLNIEKNFIMDKRIRIDINLPLLKLLR